MTKASPPVARRLPHRLERHGHVRVDDYHWLRERDNPEVLAYLRAENDYLERVMNPTDTLQSQLFGEITGRIPKEDESVPFFYEGYYYYYRYERDREYPVYCRKRGSLTSSEEILVDANVLAAGHEFLSLAGPEVSPGGDLLAFGIDTVGRRVYTLRFKNLTTGRMCEEMIPEGTGNVAWANDNKTVFYAKQHPETLRSYRIYRHEMGSDPDRDTLVYEEADEAFRCFVFRTKSKRYILIGAEQTLSSEYWFLDASDPTGELNLVAPREREHEYSVAHFRDKFYIRTNWEAGNFRLVTTPVTDTRKENWRDVVPHRADAFLSDYEIFEDFLVLLERRDGVNHIRIVPWNGDPGHDLDFEEPAYLASFGPNPELQSRRLRFIYTSLATPSSTYDYDMASREKTLLKREEVVGGYDPAEYRTERLHATAGDGTAVPISIVYRQSFEKDRPGPLLLHGYGAYGHSLDAQFHSARLSLLDRGFAFAIAHVRGGQELGRSWYEEGRLLKKKNTFTDFIACAELLVEQGYTSTDRLFAVGGSAGGLLVGAAVNMRPDLFAGVVAHVPFVDIVTTMLDTSIPLTTNEYDEWGDPNVKETYDYMLSYSPFDNLEAKGYPHLLVTAGLHDSQVQYWEPAKWVAKLRCLKTDDRLVLLKTNMEAGHGGTSGRFRRHRETALAYAFLLDLAGRTR